LFLVIAAPFIMVTVFFKDNYWLSYLFIWWLKPFFERPILFYLSRELFGEKTNIFSVLAQWKSWIHPGLFSGLSYRRLTPYRSFFMPLTVLESLGGNAYAKRALVLGSRFGSKSGWLTIVSYHIEVFFYFGFIVLIELMAPAQFNIWEFLSQEGGFNIIVSSLLQILIFAMIAPFYVASGFMLYIARRQKIIVVCLSILLGSLCQVASAQIVEEGINSAVDDLKSDISPPDSEGLVRNPHKYYRDYINSVLDGQDFRNKKKVKSWRLKEEFKADERDKSDDSTWENNIFDFFDSFGGISNDFAKLIKLLLIATLASAQQLWQQGQHRNGLALLLQGTLSKLLHEYDCSFEAGDTETDCCNVVAELSDDSLHKYMLQRLAGVI